MPLARKILIADADAETVRLLAPALRQRGFQVHQAHDGSRALQVAILRFPDLILLDERTPLLDARSFIRILRTNPRTERIPVVVMGAAPDPDRARLGAFLSKPLHLDEVLARVDQIFRRLDAARAAGESREIEGNLAQIPLVDLLQVLSANRKTGRLTVEREGERAEVSLREGRVVDAQLGALGGEKALWRLLTRHDGQFAFLPGVPSALERIDRRLDELLLEGLRQADELSVLLQALPVTHDQVELAVPVGELPEGLHPTTGEVVALLERPRSFAELVDLCHASDLEATRAVAALLERGYARRRPPDGAKPEAPALLRSQELHALKSRVARGRSSGPRTVGKVVVAGGGPLSRRAALARIATLKGYAPAEPEVSGSFGTLGRLDLGEGLLVDLVELPGEPEQRPLWRPFAAGATGALVLLPADDAAPLLAELARGLRLPVVVCGPSEDAIPEPLREAPGGLAFEGSDPAEALRALLAGAAQRSVAY
jgi:DNA-binding response OmpR family regulator